jgi:hypothetical protein
VFSRFLPELRKACVDASVPDFWAKVIMTGLKSGLITADEAKKYGGKSKVTQAEAEKVCSWLVFLVATPLTSESSVLFKRIDRYPVAAAYFYLLYGCIYDLPHQPPNKLLRPPRAGAALGGSGVAGLVSSSTFAFTKGFFSSGVGKVRGNFPARC